MKNTIEIELKGKNIQFSINSEDLNLFYDDFIQKFVIPLYTDSNDWMATIKTSIKTIERISSICHLSRVSLTNDILVKIEEKLPKEISELPHVDRIEILFESLEDYILDIKKILMGDGSQEEKRLDVSKLIENLTLFEITELMIEYAKKCEQLEK